MMHRRTKWGLAVLGFVAVLIASLVWSRRDPWPPRLVLVPDEPTRSRPQGFSADGREFLASGAEGITAWDLTTGRKQARPKPPIMRRSSLVNDRRSLVGVAVSTQNPELVRADAASGEILARTPVPSLPILPPVWLDGDRLVRIVLEPTEGSFEVATWNLTTDPIVRRPLAIKGPLSRLHAITPDGRVLAVEDLKAGGVQLWDVEADRPVGALLRRPTTSVMGGGLGTGSIFTPDGQTLIVGQDDGTLEFWDVPGSRLLKVVRVHPTNFTISALVLAPDGRTLATEGADYSGGLVESVLELIFPNRVVGADYETALLDLATDQVVGRTVDSGQPRFSPDGRWLVTHQLQGNYLVRAVPHAGPPSQKPRPDASQSR